MAAAMSASIAVCSVSESVATRASTSPRPSLASAPMRSKVLGVLVEHVGEVGLHRVAEDDRVGDLHHRGLEVDREQHALGLGVGELGGQEGVEGLGAHDGGVDDLALEDGDATP